MSIQAAKGYRTSDGVLHATVEEAQRAEIDGLLRPVLRGAIERELAVDRDVAALFLSGALTESLLANAERVVGALTIGPRSRPKARKAAGTTKPVRAARRGGTGATEAPATTEQAEAGFKAMREAAV